MKMKKYAAIILTVLLISSCQTTSPVQFDRTKSSEYAKWHTSLVRSMIHNEKKGESDHYELDRETYKPNRSICTDHMTLNEAFINDGIVGESVKDYFDELNKHFPIRKVYSYNSGGKGNYDDRWSVYRRHIAIIGDGSTYINKTVSYNFSPINSCDSKGDYKASYHVYFYVDNIDGEEFDYDKFLPKLTAKLDRDSFEKLDQKIKSRAKRGQKLFIKAVDHNQEYYAERIAKREYYRNKDSLFTWETFGMVVSGLANNMDKYSASKVYDQVAYDNFVSNQYYTSYTYDSSPADNTSSESVETKKYVGRSFAKGSSGVTLPQKTSAATQSSNQGSTSDSKKSSKITQSASINSDDNKSNSCWSGNNQQGSCLKHTTWEENEKTFFKLSNVCEDRLYIKWCANNSCGSSGLAGGKTVKKYEFHTNAHTSVKAIGSHKPGEDWTCSSLVSDW